MRILAFGTYQAKSHPRISVLIEGLRARGHEVVELNVPLGLSTDERVDMLGSSAGPAKLAAKLARSWSRLAVRSWRFRGAARPDAILIGYMGHFDVWLGRLLFPRTPIVLDHLIYAATTAVDRGIGDTGVKQRLLRQIDACAIGIADIVVLDTEEHRELLPATAVRKGVVVPVGAPSGWFEAGEAAASSEPAADPAPLRVVFFGLFTPLQGAVTIGKAIRLLAGSGIEFTMIGSGQDLAETRAAAAGGAATDWVPWVDGAELPAVVAGADVGLGIFGTTDKARRVVPNKVYQSQAAGNAVVTSDTGAQRRLLGQSATLVPAGDEVALAAALRTLADDRQLLDQRRRESRRWAVEHFSAEAVTAPLDERLSAL